jgi:hypothetical protein
MAWSLEVAPISQSSLKELGMGEVVKLKNLHESCESRLYGSLMRKAEVSLHIMLWWSVLSEGKQPVLRKIHCPYTERWKGSVAGCGQSKSYAIWFETKRVLISHKIFTLPGASEEQ